VNNLCPHFNDCGGCDLQDKAYAEQMCLKGAGLKALFSPLEIDHFAQIVPSPETEYYRNKMEYVVGGDSARPVVGLRRKGKFHRIVDLTECRIFYRDAPRIFAIFKEWMLSFYIAPYNLFRHTGSVRYLSLRHSKFYDEMMIIVVTAALALELEAGRDRYLDLVERLKEVKNIKSIYVSVNNAPADVASSDELFLLHGKGHIRERINGIDYLIDPSTFFQTNSSCCGRLYECIAAELKDMPRLRVIDLYCGSGGIALQLAGNSEKTLGIDLLPKNIEAAAKNAELNNIKNAEFLSADAEDYLSKAISADSLKDFSAIIIDPPRSGLNKKIRKILAESGRDRIIYVSCNPKSMAEDLTEMAKAYHIRKLTPVDMFPHTRHVETVAVLERRR